MAELNEKLINHGLLSHYDKDLKKYIETLLSEKTTQVQIVFWEEED